MLHQTQLYGKVKRAKPVGTRNESRCCASRAAAWCRPGNSASQVRALPQPCGAREGAAQRLCCIWSNMRRFALHPFIDGNSRTQRVFFHRYLNAAGWDSDLAPDRRRSGACRTPCCMATVDSSCLAAVLEPGVRRGEIDSGSLRATQAHRDTMRAVNLFDSMRTKKRAGVPHRRSRRREHTCTHRVSMFGGADVVDALSGDAEDGWQLRRSYERCR